VPEPAQQGQWGGADQRVQLGQQRALDLRPQPMPGLHLRLRLRVTVGDGASAREPVIAVLAGGALSVG
jgi:hypothetical protein